MESGRSRHTGLKVLLGSMGTVIVATGLIVAAGSLLTRNLPKVKLTTVGQVGLLPPGSPPPRAFFPEMSEDLGTMRSEERRTVRFSVWNKGVGPLKLKVVASCGCTEPKWPDTIEPGDSGEITALFAPPVEWDGHQEKELAVHTNDPDRPVVDLTLEVNLQAPIRASPPNGLVIPFGPETGGSGEIRLTPREDKRTQSLSVKTVSPGMTVNLIPPRPSDASREWVVQVRIPPRKTPGDIQGDISIRTSDSAQPELQLWVAGEAQSGPVANPLEIATAALTLTNAQKELARVIVSSRAGPVQVVGVETGNPKVAAIVTPGTQTSARTGGAGVGQALVSARLTPQAQPGKYAGELKIRTDDKKFPVLTVPYKVTVY